MSFVAVAIGSVGAIGGALISSNANRQAANTMASAEDRALAAQQQNTEEQRRLAREAGSQMLGEADTLGYQLSQSAHGSRDAILTGINDAQRSLNAGYDKVDQYTQQNTQIADNLYNLMNGEHSQWESVFGPIRDNLAGFYQNLSPEQLIASGVAEQRRAFDVADKQVQQSFAQRSVNSAAQDAIQAQGRYGLANDLATMRQQAPMQVANAQQGFLANSQNYMNPGSANLANAANNAANARNQQGQQALARAQGNAQADLSRGQANSGFYDALANNAGVLADARNNAYATQTGMLSSASSNLANAISTSSRNRGEINAQLATQQGATANRLLNTGLQIGGYAYQNWNNQPTANAGGTGTGYGND